MEGREQDGSGGTGRVFTLEELAEWAKGVLDIGESLLTYCAEDILITKEDLAALVKGINTRDPASELCMSARTEMVVYFKDMWLKHTRSVKMANMANYIQTSVYAMLALGPGCDMDSYMRMMTRLNERNRK